MKNDSLKRSSHILNHVSVQVMTIKVSSYIQNQKIEYLSKFEIAKEIKFVYFGVEPIYFFQEKETIGCSTYNFSKQLEETEMQSSPS